MSGANKRLQIIKSLNKKSILDLLDENMTIDELNKLVIFTDKKRLLKTLSSIYSSTEIIDIIYSSSISNEILLNKVMEKYQDNNS